MKTTYPLSITDWFNVFFARIFHAAFKRLWPVKVQGLALDTKEKFFPWWGFVMERQLFKDEWVDEFKAAISPVVIDVGANCGMFTEICRRLNPSLSVFCFEPQPDICKLDYAKVINAAASDCNGESLMRRTKSGDECAFVSDEGELKIKLVRIDDVVPASNVFLMKIDVQGHELKVLRGAKETLKRTKWLIVECVTEEELNEVCAELDRQHIGKIGTWDYLFKLN